MKKIAILAAVFALTTGPVLATDDNGPGLDGLGSVDGSAGSLSLSGAVSGAANVGNGRSAQRASAFSGNRAGAYGLATPASVDVETYSVTVTGANVWGSQRRAIGGGAALGAAGGYGAVHGEFGHYSETPEIPEWDN